VILHFLDTSAIVKHYRAERGSQRVDALFTDSEILLTISDLTIVELASAFVRLRRMSQIEEDAFNAALARFTLDTKEKLTVARISGETIHSARDLVLKHDLRTLDALQLASVLSIRSDSTTFVSADTNLLQAAQSNGLQTLNPLD